MRLPVMIAAVVLLAAGTCRAEDPLESLNTVEGALSELAHYRAVHTSTDSPRHPAAPVPSGDAVSPAGEAPAGGGAPSCCAEPPFPGGAPAEPPVSGGK